MFADVIYPGWTPFTLLWQTKNVPGFIRSNYQILEYGFEHVSGGHLGRSGNCADVLVLLEYVLDIKRSFEITINTSATDDPNIGCARFAEESRNGGRCYGVLGCTGWLLCEWDEGEVGWGIWLLRMSFGLRMLVLWLRVWRSTMGYLVLLLISDWGKLMGLIITTEWCW